MRLTALRAMNYTGLRTVMFEIPQGSNVVLIAGPNGAGKTALIEGIRLALTGEPPRGLKYKKDYQHLITLGEKDGWVGISTEHEGRESEYRVSMKTGIASGGGAPLEPAQVYTLDPAAFIALDATARRKALFSRTGVSLTKSEVSKDLLKDKHPETLVNQAMTQLGGGFDAATEYCRKHATLNKGEWQGLTGQKYASTGADTWKLEPPISWEDPVKLDQQLQSLRQAVTKAQADLEATKADERLHQSADAQRAEANKLGKHELMVSNLEQEIEESKTKIASYDSQATSKEGWTAECPCCSKLLLSTGAGRLEEYIAPPGNPSMAKAGAEVERGVLRDLLLTLARAKQAVESARAAKLSIDRLPERPTADDLRSDEQVLQDALADMRTVEAQHAAAVDAAKAAANAADVTDKAQKAHQLVKQWTALAGALEALPGKYLSKALKVINTELSDASSVLPQSVQLGEDMEVRYGPLPYGLLSRSQQWRVRLALGIALGGKDGGIVLMDEFDLVEPAGRGAILQYVAKQDRVQVVLGATLKAKPRELPGITTYWLGKEE